jgi:hypothetical protein
LFFKADHIEANAIRRLSCRNCDRNGEPRTVKKAQQNFEEMFGKYKQRGMISVILKKNLFTFGSVISIIYIISNLLGSK